MLIDCDTCRAPEGACRDCVMTVLLQVTEAPVELDDAERDALDSLARAGLVPPLRLVVGVASGYDLSEGASIPSDFPRDDDELWVLGPDFAGSVREIA